MLMKRNPLEDLPAPSSSDDEEVESSAEEEEDSSSEEEEDVPKPPSPSKQAESGSESETESESESEQPANKGSGKAILTVKDTAPPPPPVAKSGSKRPSEGTSKETPNSKRTKKKDEEEKKIGGEDAKKPGAIQRLWTEEDEIAVLQGMIDFKNGTGKSPYEDRNVYYDYIKKSISFEVSKGQFMDKIRRLKNKYIGKEKSSYTKHEQKSYRLFQYILGLDGMALALESVVKSNGASKKKTKLDSVKQDLSFGAAPNGETVVADDDEKDVEATVAVDWFENSFLAKAFAGFGADEHYWKQKWGLVSAENKNKVGEKLKLLQAKEFEVVLEKTEIFREVTDMIAHV